MGKKISSTGPFLARLAVIIIIILSAAIIYLEARESQSLEFVVIIPLFILLLSYVFIDLNFDRHVVIEEDTISFRRVFRSQEKIPFKNIRSIDWSPYTYGLAGWSGRRGYIIKYLNQA